MSYIRAHVSDFSLLGKDGKLFAIIKYNTNYETVRTFPSIMHSYPKDMRYSVQLEKSSKARPIASNIETVIVKDDEPKRKITPAYPSSQRTKTLMGVALPGIIEIKKDETAPIAMRYRAFLASRSGMRFEATIVTHLDLKDYCDLHNYRLLHVIGVPTIALPGDKTSLG